MRNTIFNIWDDIKKRHPMINMRLVFYGIAINIDIRIMGITDFDFFSQEEAQEFRIAELKVIEKGEIYYNPEEKFRDKAGNIRILQGKKMPFYIPYMDQTGLLGVQLDVT